MAQSLWPLTHTKQWFSALTWPPSPSLHPGLESLHLVFGFLLCFVLCCLVTVRRGFLLLLKVLFCFVLFASYQAMLGGLQGCTQHPAMLGRPYGARNQNQVGCMLGMRPNCCSISKTLTVFLKTHDTIPNTWLEPRLTYAFCFFVVLEMEPGLQSPDSWLHNIPCYSDILGDGPQSNQVRIWGRIAPITSVLWWNQWINIFKFHWAEYSELSNIPSNRAGSTPSRPRRKVQKLLSTLSQWPTIASPLK